jgi:3-phosphoshikimate 1-carboxyvinyltransferase
LIEGLRNLGADIDYMENEGFAPLKVRGRQLVSKPVHMEAGESSQFTSALMLIGPYVSGGLEILPSGKAVSAPYIDMTAQLMREAGAEVEISGERISVSEGGYRAAHFDVECDWSAASYIYAFLALMRRGSIDLPGLTKSGLQGDERVARIFSQFGVRTEFHSRGARLLATGFVEAPGEIDFVDCPDLAQTVAAVATGLRQPLKLTGLQSLRHKETDRIAALKSELAKCGVLCRAGDDYLELVDFKVSNGVPTIATYDDHRMAMAFAPLAVVFGEINIEDPEVVSKSFPSFWDVAGQVGMVGMAY